MATDLITIATTAVLSQFLGPSAKHLGELVLERGKQVGRKAVSYLAAVGREPQSVELKVLLPLVQAAALELNDSLADKWAALLANAADPAQRVNVEASFVDVLNLLTPAAATALELVYKQVPLDDPEHLNREIPAVPTAGFANELGLSQQQFVMSVELLLRLRLCALSTENFALFNGEPQPPAASRVCPTIYGREFLKACTPPCE